MGFLEAVGAVDMKVQRVCEDHPGREDEEEWAEGPWSCQTAWPSGAGGTISSDGGAGEGNTEHSPLDAGRATLGCAWT